MAKIISARKGGGSKPHQPREMDDNLISRDKIKILLALSDGEVDEGFTLKDLLFDDVPVVAADGTENYQNVRAEFRYGTQTQSYIPGFTESNNEITVQRDVSTETPYVISVTNQVLSAIRIRMMTDRIAHTKDNGDTVGWHVEYRFDMAVNGGAYEEVTRTVFDGKNTGGYDRSIRINLPENYQQVLIRVVRLTADDNTDRTQSKFRVQSYSEVIDAKFRYPLTALLFVEFDSDLFPNQLPTISVRKKWKKIQVPVNYDPVARTYSGSWNGMFKTAWSNNPAWVLYDLIMSQRYGLDQKELGIDVDKWSLYEVAQYCDQMVPDGHGGQEPRYLCDMVVQSQVEAYRLIRDVCSIFRGMSFYNGESLSIVIDKPRDPVYLFTNDNVVDGAFARVFASEKSMYTSVNVMFDDRENMYNQDVEPVFDNEASRRFGNNPTDITAIGCTRRSEANRRGRWIIKTNLQSTTVNFATGLEGMIPMIGDVIAVADNHWQHNIVYNLSGRLMEVSGVQVFTSFRVDARPGDFIIVNRPDGKPQKRTISRVSSDGKTITLNVGFGFAVQPDAVFAIERSDLAFEQYVVTKIEKGDGDEEFVHRITAIEYDPTKYDAIDYGVVIDQRPTSIVDPDHLKAPENVKISSFSRVVQGMSVETMVVNWSKVQYANRYEMQWRKDNGNWNNTPQTAATEIDVEGIYAGVYEVRVRAVSAAGNVSPWSDVTVKSLTGKTGKPNKPINLTATDDEVFGIRVKWGMPDGSGDTAYIELQQAPDDNAGGFNPDAATLVSMVPYPQREYWHSVLPSGFVNWYRVRSVDRIGNVSDWTDFVRGMATDDVDKIGEVVKIEFEETEGFKELVKTVDELIGQMDEQSQELEETGNTMKDYGAKLRAQAEADIENALANNTDVIRMTKENGKRKAEFRFAVNLVATESEARAEAITKLSAQFDEEIGAAVTRMDQAIAKEGEARAKAIADLKAQIDDEVVAQITTVQEALAKETETRVTQYQEMSARMGKAEGNITNNATAIVTEKDARVQQYNQLNSKIDTNQGSTNASIGRLDQAITDEKNARAQQYTQLNAKIDTNKGTMDAEVRRLDKAIVDERNARSTAITQVTAKADTAQSTANTANGKADTANGTANNALNKANQADGKANQAIATASQKVDSWVSENGSIGASYSVALGVKRAGVSHNAGFMISLEGTAAAPKARCFWDVDSFAIGRVSGGKISSMPFFVEGNAVYMQNAFIKNGSIDNAKIGSFIQSNNYVANSAGWRLDKNGTFVNFGSTANEGSMKQDNQTITVRDRNGRVRVQIGRITGVW